MLDGAPWWLELTRGIDSAACRIVAGEVELGIVCVTVEGGKVRSLEVTITETCSSETPFCLSAGNRPRSPELLLSRSFSLDLI